METSAAASGAPAAFGAVVRSIERPLRRYLIVRAPATADVDDLAQQTLVQAFEALPRWRATGDPAGWLFGIARNIVRRAWRTHARDQTRQDALQIRLAETLARRADHLPQATDDPRLSALAECEALLSERWRRIVGWYYRDRLPLERISRSLGNEPSTVGATLFRIRAQLRACVEEKLR